MDREKLGFAAKILASFLEKAPPEENWNEIKNEGLLTAWFIASANPLNTQGLACWALAVEENDLDLGADFTRLFLSDESFIQAPPYASYYLDQSGEMFTGESLAVQSCYDRSNFRKPLPTEPADHLASELAFVGALLMDGSPSKELDDMLRSFLAFHLTPWCRECCLMLETRSHTNFYRGVGYLVHDLIELLISSLALEPENRYLHRRYQTR